MHIVVLKHVSLSLSLFLLKHEVAVQKNKDNTVLLRKTTAVKVTSEKIAVVERVASVQNVHVVHKRTKVTLSSLQNT